MEEMPLRLNRLGIAEYSLMRVTDLGFKNLNKSMEHPSSVDDKEHLSILIIKCNLIWIERV